jgi:hypothetical protein
MQWFLHQPFNVHEPLIPNAFPVAHTLNQLVSLLLDAPFLLLPIVALFLPEIRTLRPRVIAIACAGFAVCLFLATYPSHLRHGFGRMLEPTNGDWVSVYGMHVLLGLQGNAPLFLHRWAQVLLTIGSFGGLLGLVVSYLRTRRMPPAADTPTGSSWTQIRVLVAPFTIVYILLLIPRSTSWAFDRYLLPLLVLALIGLVRYYQERIQPRLPLASVLLVTIMAIYGIAVTHGMFSFSRARVALAAEIRASGVPDTSVDNGWEYNFDVELQHADHINDSRISLPANAYVPIPRPAGPCQMVMYDETPHIRPLYGVSFDPNACYGPAPFTPVHYSRWPYSTPGTLYVVRYTPDAKP